MRFLSLLTWRLPPNRQLFRKLNAGMPAALLFALALGVPLQALANDGGSNSPRNVVYVQNNDYTPGKNAINAYGRDPQSGCLTLIGTYYTGGTGLYNFDDRIGPDDHAQEVVANADHTLLFTVNSGSDTISVFRINSDGSLTLAPGSPVSSGGIQPVSLGLNGDTLYVVNSDGDPNRLNALHPNITAFQVAASGRLSPIPDSTVELPNLSYPEQALVVNSASQDGQEGEGSSFLFGAMFTAVPYQPQVLPFLPPAGSLLQSFQILSDGRLNQAPNSPMVPPPNSRADSSIPQSGYTLGMDHHPWLPIIYVGYVVAGRLGVFTYDSTGSLHFVTDVALGPNDLTICWLAVSPDGKWVFTSNAGSNSVTVYDISGTVKPDASPLSPVYVTSFPMNIPQPAPSGEFPPAFITPTVSFQIATDPSGQFVYAVGHELVADNAYPDGNLVHTLRVDAGGNLTEPVCSPAKVTNIPSGAHPQGVVVF